MKSELEEVYINWMVNTVMHHWKRDQTEPHLVNVISAYRGWTPLETGERMRVTFGKDEYEITKIS